MRPYAKTKIGSTGNGEEPHYRAVVIADPSAKSVPITEVLVMTSVGLISYAVTGMTIFPIEVSIYAALSTSWVADAEAVAVGLKPLTMSQMPSDSSQRNSGIVAMPAHTEICS